MKKTPVSFSSQTENPNMPGVLDISPEELAQKLDSVHIIDVRRPEEYTGELGHIKGSTLIVLDTIPMNIDSIPKDEPVVFICKGGGRSAQATAFAKQSGCQHVFNMTGGMLLWNKLALPVNKST
ncbi:MAG TPA: rhodanese-like domain-containing protein [Bdellovibrionales bacterium]|nr:rhodanese-like domain-containing protein [Bdellovibrionales bacterium]